MEHRAIIYLSKSQVRTMWQGLDKKRFKLDEFSAKASLSLTPSAELGGKWSAQKGPSGDVWPPWESGELVRAIDAYVAKNARVGIWSDLYDNPNLSDFYSLEGRLKFANPDLTHDLFHGRFKMQSIDAVFCGELETDQIKVSLSLENIFGIDWDGDVWEVTESLTYHMLHALSEAGFVSHGLFTLTEARRDHEKTARAVYLATGR